MLGSLVAFSSLLALAPAVLGADAPVWGQCGGQGWTGPTTCPSGSTCKYSNEWYSQCIPGTAITTPSVTTTQTSTSAPTTTSTSKTNYWFSFGDSYTATGFNINGAQPGPSNPLGNPAYPGSPTTPGPNWIDGATVTYNHSLVLTYNFAVGGATIDKSILPPYSGVSMSDQVNTFLNWNSGAGKGKWSSANAIFSVWIGINDIGGTYFKGGDRAAFSDTMLKTEFALIQKLYDVGARNFLFINVPPMERSPREINNSGAALQKSVINTHNTKYVTYVNDFASSHSGVKTWLYDSHTAFNKILDSLSSYGFSTSPTSYGGANDFWGDNYHPSSKAQLLFAKDVGNLLAGTPW